MQRLRTDEIDRFFDHGVYLPARRIVLGPEIDSKGKATTIFLKGMDILEFSSKTDPITVVINNVGGDIYHGLAVFDRIAGSPCEIVALVYGQAMSMGSWILQAADQRHISPNATLMLHYGHTSLETPADEREWRRIQKLFEDTCFTRIRERVASFPLSRFRKKLEADWYIPADEAVELGLADRILTHG